MEKYNINSFLGQVWLIQPERLVPMMDIAISGISIKTTAPSRKSAGQSNVAYLPLYGVIDQHQSWLHELFGGTSTEVFGAMFDSAIADSSVRAVLIDTDSPGGSVYGVQELSDKIYNARGKKPIIAVVNSLMASAAYWVASAADEIVITPSGEAGSIGVIAVHFDYSEFVKKGGIKPTIIKAGKYKAEGNPYESLGDDAETYIQKRIDDYYTAFVSAVARNRGASVGTVLSDYGQGRVLGAKDAKAVGMVDNIATLDSVYKALSIRKTTLRRAAQSAEQNKRAIELARLK